MLIQNVISRQRKRSYRSLLNFRILQFLNKSKHSSQNKQNTYLWSSIYVVLKANVRYIISTFLISCFCLLCCTWNNHVRIILKCLNINIFLFWMHQIDFLKFVLGTFVFVKWFPWELAGEEKLPFII